MRTLKKYINNKRKIIVILMIEFFIVMSLALFYGVRYEHITKVRNDMYNTFVGNNNLIYVLDSSYSEDGYIYRTAYDKTGNELCVIGYKEDSITDIDDKYLVVKNEDKTINNPALYDSYLKWKSYSGQFANNDYKSISEFELRLYDLDKDMVYSIDETENFINMSEKYLELKNTYHSRCTGYIQGGLAIAAIMLVVHVWDYLYKKIRRRFSKDKVNENPLKTFLKKPQKYGKIMALLLAFFIAWLYAFNFNMIIFDENLINNTACRYVIITVITTIIFVMVNTYLVDRFSFDNKVDYIKKIIENGYLTGVLDDGKDSVMEIDSDVLENHFMADLNKSIDEDIIFSDEFVLITYEYVVSKYFNGETYNPLVIPRSDIANVKPDEERNGNRYDYVDVAMNNGCECKLKIAKNRCEDIIAML